MAESFNIRIVDHSNEVLSQFRSLARAALEMVGSQAEAYAKLTITDSMRDGIDLTQYGEFDNSRVDRGQLRNSITHVVQQDGVYIGSNIPYAPYHELGTGIYASQPGGRRTPWKYYNRKMGTVMWTKGLYPLHFLKNAVANHIQEYKKIISEIMSGNQPT